VPTTCLVTKAYLSLIPVDGDAPHASARILQSADRVRSFRARLELVPQMLAELERKVDSAAAELALAHAQSSADREAVVRLEVALADREELRSTLRDRLSELGRVLGSA
jgi:chromosome segregation ATPase